MRTEARDLLAVGIFGGRSRTGDRIESLLYRGREFSPLVSISCLAASAAILLMFAAAGAFTPRWIAFAQETRSQSFEAASVKLDKSDSGIVAIRPMVGGRFSAANVNLKLLISIAYGVRNSDISGGPGWIGSTAFDIEAKANGNPDRKQIRLMLQSLLEDRFKLAVRKESKDLSVYVLTVAKNGARLPEAREGNCVVFDSDKPLPLPAPGQTLPVPCGAFRMMPHDGGRRLEAGAVSMPELAAALTQLLDRPVVDKTAILETFDVHLDWIPGLPRDDVSGPSLLTAVQEQLGLKLESRKSPVETVVIDHVEKPDAN
jgi:uncharacterized protein (TIGR03435 family)